MKKTKGKRKRLQEIYPKLEEFIKISNEFNLASIWGYQNPKMAFYDNPEIILGAHPSEYRKAT